MALRGPDAPHTPPAAAQEADQRLHQRRRAALEAPRRADARQVPHEQPEIDAADLDEQPFQDVGMPAQMDAAGLGARWAVPAARGRSNRLRRRLAYQSAAGRDPARDVAAEPMAANPTIGCCDTPCQRRPPASTCSAAVTSAQGRRVARTRVLHRHAHDGACVQVDRMLGGVRQMVAIFASGCAGGSSPRSSPSFCGSGRTGPTPAGRLGQPGQKRVVALARIPPHNAPHRALASSRGIVPTVRPTTSVASASRCNTQVNTA